MGVLASFRLVLVILTPFVLFAQNLPTHPVNLGFEESFNGEERESAPILGWRLPDNQLVQGFRAGLSYNLPHSGRSYGKLIFQPGGYSSHTASLKQRLDGPTWRGKRVRFQAALAVSAGSYARLRIAVARASGELDIIDSTEVRTPDWAMREVVTDIASDATEVSLILYLTGGRTASFDTVSSGIPG